MKKTLILLLLGLSLLNAKSQQNLNENIIIEKTDLEKDIVKNSIAFSFGTGKEEILIVTDPECPFCKKLAIDKNNKFKNYKVTVVLFALSYHKEAKSMISYILSGKDNIEKTHRYKEIMIGDDISYKEHTINKELVSNYLKNAKKTLDKLTVKKVPSIFDEEEGEYFDTSYEEL